MLAQPSVESEAQARARHQLGQERFRVGDYRGALEAFVWADRILGEPTTGLDLARTRAKLGLLLQARVRALAASRHPPEPDEPESFERAREEAGALVQELEQRIPSIRIELVGPDGALTHRSDVTILLDGEPVAPEQRRAARRVNPGAHAVVAAAPGLAAFRGSVHLQEREQRVLQVKLVPAERIERGELDEDAEGIPLAVPFGFGLGGAALLAGVVTGALTMSAAADLDEACPDKRCPEQQREALADARTLGNASTALFIGGALGVGVGVSALAMWLAGADPAEDGYASLPARGGAHAARGPSLRAWIGPGSGGLAGRF